MKRLHWLSRTMGLVWACVLSVAGFAQRSNHTDKNLFVTFQNPPNAARPRVWGHWMNGNVTIDGIRKDLLWMHKSGIGGFHNFDAGLSTPLLPSGLLGPVKIVLTK